MQSMIELFTIFYAYKILASEGLLLNNQYLPHEQFQTVLKVGSLTMG